MKIQYFGKTPKWRGKTLWEIVGNLKNFGVGRLVKKDTGENIPEPCYFKIIRVVPLPPPRKEYMERNVIVWIEEVFKGRKLEIQKEHQNDYAQFQLIPKHEEELYTKAKVDPEATKRVVYKYTEWPPFYKKLWEAEQLRVQKVPKPIPKLVTAMPESKLELVVSEEKTVEQLKSSLPMLETSVEEALKKLVHLKKMVNKLS